LFLEPHASNAAFIEGAATARSKKPADVVYVLSFLVINPEASLTNLRRKRRWGSLDQSHRESRRAPGGVASLPSLRLELQPEQAARPVAAWSTAWEALDDVDSKLSDLTHTAEVLNSIDTASPKALGLIVHMWRHLMSDLALLQQANPVARAAILNPAKAEKGGAL
jgi:hypothetical protein